MRGFKCHSFRSFVDLFSQILTHLKRFRVFYLKKEPWRTISFKWSLRVDVVFSWQCSSGFLITLWSTKLYREGLWERTRVSWTRTLDVLSVQEVARRYVTVPASASTLVAPSLSVSRSLLAGSPLPSTVRSEPDLLIAYHFHFWRNPLRSMFHFINRQISA